MGYGAKNPYYYPQTNSRNILKYIYSKIMVECVIPYNHMSGGEKEVGEHCTEAQQMSVDIVFSDRKKQELWA